MDEVKKTVNADNTEKSEILSGCKENCLGQGNSWSFFILEAPVTEKSCQLGQAL